MLLSVGFTILLRCVIGSGDGRLWLDVIAWPISAEDEMKRAGGMKEELYRKKRRK